MRRAGDGMRHVRHRNWAARPLLVVVLVIAVVATGCTGDDGGSSLPTPSGSATAAQADDVDWAPLVGVRLAENRDGLIHVRPIGHDLDVTKVDGSLEFVDHDGGRATDLELFDRVVVPIAADGSVQQMVGLGGDGVVGRALAMAGTSTLTVDEDGDGVAELHYQLRIDSDSGSADLITWDLYVDEAASDLGLAFLLFGPLALCIVDDAASPRPDPGASRLDLTCDARESVTTERPAALGQGTKTAALTLTAGGVESPGLDADICETLEEFTGRNEGVDETLVDILDDLEGEPDAREQLDDLLDMLDTIQSAVNGATNLAKLPSEALERYAEGLGLDPDDSDLLLAVYDKLIGSKLEDLATQVQDTALEALLRRMGLRPGSAANLIDALRSARGLSGHVLLNLYLTAVQELLDVLTQKIETLQVELQISDDETASRRVPSTKLIREPWRARCDPDTFRGQYDAPWGSLELDPPGGPSGRSKGEPHLSTYDGLAYDFQLAGEFVVTRSTVDDFEVQARYVPRRWATPESAVSVTAAVAMSVGGSRIMLDLDDLTDGDPANIRIDGAATPITTEPTALAGGGSVVASSGTFAGRMFVYVQAADATTIEMQIGFADVINWQVHPSPERAEAMEGLFGDYDGDPSDDLRTQDGTRLPTDPPDIDRLGRSWRVEAARSLFDYDPGEDTTSFTIEDYPPSAVTLADLSPDDVAAAEQACREAGLADDPELAWCTFDVAVTGDATFAIDGADRFIHLPRVDRIELELGTTVDASTGRGAGELEELGGADVYEVSAEAGDRLFVDVPTDDPRACADTAFHVTIFDPDQSEITRPFRHLLSTLCRQAGAAFELTESGTYEVVVDADSEALRDGLAATGSYTLEIGTRPVDRFQVELSEPIAPGRPGPGAGTIEKRGSVDVYEFMVAPGTEVLIDVGDVDGAGCDADSALEYEILQPGGGSAMPGFGPPLTGACRYPRTQGWRLEEGGAYTLRVGADGYQAGRGDSPTGTYRLTIRAAR